MIPIDCRHAARAKLFGNCLNFKQKVECVDAPYFDAPGTLEAPLGYKEVRQCNFQDCAAARGDVEAAALLLTPVTAVFCGVDAAARAALLSGVPSAAVQKTHRLLRECVLQTLRAFPGGYLCRDQEGELRFLLAFSSPQVRRQKYLSAKDIGCSDVLPAHRMMH